MPFAGNFTAVQQTNLRSIVITDTSSGADPNLIGRTISLFKADGTLLTGSTIDFPIVSGIGDSITIDVLDKDYSLNILIAWASSSPLSGSTYTATIANTFLGYTKQFRYELVQDLAADENTRRSTYFYQNLSELDTEIKSAETAQTYSDVFSAQAALNRAKVFIDNPDKYF